MKTVYKSFTVTLMLAVILVATFYIGKNVGTKSVQYVTETVTEYDTVTKVIKEPYAVLKDTTIYVELPGRIDTVTVIREYFAKHYVEREFKDTNVVITVQDTIYKNDIFTSSIKYKWMQPTSVTTNTSVTNNYYKYLSVGVSTNDVMHINSFSLDLSYHTKQFYYLAGYDPVRKTFKAGFGTTLFKFK